LLKWIIGSVFPSLIIWVFQEDPEETNKIEERSMNRETFKILTNISYNRQLISHNLMDCGLLIVRSEINL
jgi:hypothetical protein